MAGRPRRHYVTVSTKVDVDVDIAEALECMEDETLVEELKRRRKYLDVFKELRALLEAGDVTEALSIVRAECGRGNEQAAEYARAKAGKHPYLFIPSSGPHGSAAPSEAQAGPAEGNHAHPDAETRQ